MRMQREVKLFMDEYQMVQPGDVIVAGVSGGPDSVCMLLLLCPYCKEKGATVEVVHVNHQIRQEAVKDADYVKRLCEKLQVPFYLYTADVKDKAEKWNCGLEEAGRKVRYQILEERAALYGEKGKIAVAHNKNDLAETALFHLFRGSSVSGMAGILPVRNQIIRPLLGTERKEIEEFLKQNEIVHGNWCVDYTNGENEYTRNKIRNVLFPYVEENICHNAAIHVANLANDMAEVRDWLEQQAEKAYDDCLIQFEKDEKIVFSISKMGQYPNLVKRQMMMLGMERLNQSKKDITATHIKEILALAEKEAGKEIYLPYGCVAEKRYESLWIYKNSKEKKNECYYEISPPAELTVEDRKISFSVKKAENYGNIEAKPYTKCFDYDKIKSPLVVRTRKTGDFLVINKTGNHKLLKDYFITEKVPRRERDRVLLLADGSHILWVAGMRISEAYKVTDETKRILQVKMEKII